MTSPTPGLSTTPATDTWRCTADGCDRADGHPGLHERIGVAWWNSAGTSALALPLSLQLAAATEDAGWCNQIPHTLTDCARIVGTEAARDSEAAGPIIRGGTDGHADPTASGHTVTTRGPADDVTLEAFAGRLVSLEDAHDLAACVGVEAGRSKWITDDRQRRLAAAISAMHAAIPTIDRVAYSLPPEQVDHITMLVRSIAADAAWLYVKAEGIWRHARTDSRRRTEQKPLKGCQSCARILNPSGEPTFEPVARGQYANYCRWCGDYIGAEKREPPVAAVQWKLRHGKAPNSKVMSEALAADLAASRGR